MEVGGSREEVEEIAARDGETKVDVKEKEVGGGGGGGGGGGPEVSMKTK